MASDVVRAARVLSAEGLIEAFGHVSGRRSADTFFLTPRRGLSTVETDDLTVLRLAQNDPRGFEVVSGDPGQVPLEASIHAAVFAARDDVGGIVRDHGFSSTVLGVTGIPLVPLHALGATVPGEVPVHDSAALVSDLEGGTVLADLLGAGSAVLMRGNGRVVVGGSVAHACAKAYLLEESARVQLAARSTGRIPTALSDEEQRRAGEEVGSPAQLLRVWDHLCAKHAVGPA